MKAMVLVGKGKLELRDIPVPALAPESVLVKVEAAGICNSTDLRILDAPDPTQVWPGEAWPCVMGHEVCGTIVDVGKEVSGWRVGERIGGWCPPSGGFAEYCLMRPARMAAVHVPNAIPSDAGTLLEPVIGTTRYFMPKGIMSIVKRARTALVTGLGPTGLLYVRECRLMGIQKIYASDRHAERRRLAVEFGATEVFSPDDDPFQTLAGSAIRIDVAIDTTGKDIAYDLFKVLHAGGALIPFGVGFDWNSRRADLEERGIALSSAQVEEARAAAPMAVEWLAGDVPMNRVITKRICLGDIPAALEALRQRKEIKIVALMK